MPYSPDSDQNKENFVTPSAYSMTEQLLYKMASLDAAVQQGFRRLDEKMDRFQSDLHDSQIATNDRINNLDRETNDKFAFKRARIDSLESKFNSTCKDTETRLHDIETWQKVAMARAGIVGGAIIFIWTFVAPFVRGVLGLPGG